MKQNESDCRFMHMRMLQLLVRLLIDTAGMLYVILAMLIILMAILLMVVCETNQALLFALAVILFCPAPFLFWLTWRLKHVRKRTCLISSSILLFLSAISLVICYLMTPNGESEPDSCIRSVFTGRTAYERTSVANLVPEMDQLKLGSYIISRMDPIIDAKQSVRIRTLFMNIYRQMQASDDFNRLGSAMNYTYRDMFGFGRPMGHLYEYIPNTPGNKPLPVILFVHGSLGNFKGYLWVLKQFADQNQFAIIAPTFGAGNWDLEGGTDTIEQARQYCLKHPRIIKDSIYLCGLSNGGKGVSRTALSSPKAYKGLIFISPVMEDEILADSRFIAGWKQRRILIIHGTNDNRIPYAHIKGCSDMLRRDGIEVQAHFYEGEDHFLMFSKPADICRDIASFTEQ